MAISEYPKRLPDVRISNEMAEALCKVKTKKAKYIRDAVRWALIQDSFLKE